MQHHAGLRVSRAERPPRALFSGRTRVPRIAVLGAGMSGLVAAYELQRAGLPVKVFERSGRVGGRIETFRFPGTRHLGELGAMRIPGRHVNTLHYVSEMGLKDRLSRFITIFKDSQCVINTGALAGAQRRPHREHATGNGLLDHLVQAVLSRLTVVVNAISPGEIRDAFRELLSDTLYGELSGLIAATADPSRFRSLLDAPIEELVDFFCERDEQMTPSLRLFFHDIALEVSRDLFFLRGGMQQLPERLAGHVSDALRLSCEIESIHSHEDRVELVIRDHERGTVRRETFDHVICTIPVPVLRTMTLTGIDARKMAAIRQARYASTSKVLFLCREAFWRSPPYGIRAGASSIDEVVRQMYYTDLDTNEGSDDEGGVLLACYSLGRDSERLANYPDDDLTAILKDRIGRVHPEVTQPGMIEAFKVRHWQKQEGFLGGCSVGWPIYHPGVGSERDVVRMWEDLAAPGGRLLFAGEHCSKEKAWIEGAVKSGLRAVSSLVHELGVGASTPAPVELG